MKIITALVILLTASVVHAEEIKTDWTTQDTIMQFVFTAFLEVDREQTQWISKSQNLRIKVVECTEKDGNKYDLYTNENMVGEVNPIIGDKASKRKINTYFGAVAVTHAAISYGLRKSGWNIAGVPMVTIWQSISIGVEATQVGRNYSLGVGMNS